jgi:hypothetical protein
MRARESRPASVKGLAHRSGQPESVKSRKDRQPREDKSAKPELEGKTDSGPEPEIHGREIPPQQ